VTNAFWATTQEQARAVIARVPAISAYSFSTDIYHQRAIPLDYIKNAMSAANESKKAYNIAVCTENEEEENYKKIIEELRAIGEEENIYDFDHLTGWASQASSEQDGFCHFT